MLDAVKLEQLRQAATAEDWIAAAMTCHGLKLERRDPLDRFRVDELAKAVRQRSAGLVVDIIRGFGYPPPPVSSS